MLLGYKKDGRIDLRMLPTIIERPLGKERADGIASQILHNDATEPTLEVDSKLTGRRHMEAVIHEALHLAGHTLPEQVVLQTARSIAMVMWKMKFRRTE